MTVLVLQESLSCNKGPTIKIIDPQKLTMFRNFVNPFSHGVYDLDIFIGGGALKTHSLKPDLTLSDHYDNHTIYKVIGVTNNPKDEESSFKNEKNMSISFFFWRNLWFNKKFWMSPFGASC